MKVYINQENAPLKGVPNSLKERKTQEWLAQAQAQGINVTGAGADQNGDGTVSPWITLDISQMAKHDLPQRYRPALLQFLEQNAAERVDVESADILTLYAHPSHDAVSYSVGARLRDQDPDMTATLTALHPDEIYEALGNAIDLATTDGLNPGLDEGERFVQEMRNEQHLLEAATNGVIDANEPTADDLWESYGARFTDAEPQATAGWNDDTPTFRDPLAGGQF